MTKLIEIKAQIAELQREVDEVFKNDKQGAIADIISKMYAYNINISELEKREKATKSYSKTSIPVKYRKSEYEIWGGRGPKPKWVKEVEEKGENLEVYRVQEEITQ
ncbi:MAG: H-NS histone family protein [Chlorobium sp.]|nr:MAG: H-NS histone family protein [Chlorobium sp.]